MEKHKTFTYKIILSNKERKLKRLNREATQTRCEIKELKKIIAEGE